MRLTADILFILKEGLLKIGEIMRYDIAIIGSGPAGLAAAINAKIRNKNIILFGTEDISQKLIKAPFVENYLGIGNISGLELKDKFKKTYR